MSAHLRKTESELPESSGIDTWNDADILGAFVAGQERAIAAVNKFRKPLTLLPHVWLGMAACSMRVPEPQFALGCRMVQNCLLPSAWQKTE
jgi:hypothetical protein